MDDIRRGLGYYKLASSEGAGESQCKWKLSIQKWKPVGTRDRVRYGAQEVALLIIGISREGGKRRAHK